jgi:hypothetical protein
MKRIRNMWLVAPVLVAALGIGVAVTVASSGERPAIPTVVETNPPPSTLPTGPVMSQAAAADAAVTFAHAQVTGEPIVVAQKRGTFASNEALISPDVHIPVNPDTRPLLESDAYLTVMQGQFTG